MQGRTPAKINLYLRVVGRLPNGYHELETFFLPLAEPADEITVRRNPDGGLAVIADSTTVPDGESNLCAKAVRSFAKFAKRKGTEVSVNWRIEIRKNIPVAAGMGGGSSDAALVLNFLNQTENQLFTDAELREIALGIGADVPFFLKPQPAVASGVGEVLRPLEFNLDFIPLLVVAPMFPVSTAWCFRQLDSGDYNEYCDSRFSSDEFIDLLSRNDWPAIGKLLCNDLAEAVFYKFPILDIVRTRMLDLGACGVCLSGSGPTLFALCRDHEHLCSMKRQLQLELPESFRFFS